MRQLATAALNVARDAHYELNPVTGLYERALLLEGARTNAFTYSEDFSNAAWVKGAATVSVNAAAGPDGVATADKLVEDATAAVHYVSRASGTFTANVDQTYSIYVKAGERARGYLYGTSGSDIFGVSFDLGTGTLASFTAGAGVLTRSRIAALGNGWYRISITGKINAAATTTTVVLALADAAGTRSYAGDGASGFYATGFQNEVDAPFASSYIPTAGAAVTRAADILNFPFAVAPQEMTIYVRFVERGTTLSGSGNRLLQIGAAANTSPRAVISTDGTRYVLTHQTAAGAVVSNAVGTPALGSLVELRGVLGADGKVTLHQSLDGAAPTTGITSGALALSPAWSATQLWLNGINNTLNGSAAFLAVKLARGVKTLDQMRALARAA